MKLVTTATTKLQNKQVRLVTTTTKTDLASTHNLVFYFLQQMKLVTTPTPSEL